MRLNTGEGNGAANDNAVVIEHYADLSGADFKRANLRQANPRGVNLRFADLCDANFSGVNLWKKLVNRVG
ncbi:MAG: pentapeptide repeat-containing protein [Chloroflexota bacterium]